MRRRFADPSWRWRLFPGLACWCLVMAGSRRVVAPALSSPRVRAFAFHFVSQLGIRYRKSPAVAEGEPTLSKGPRAGDRLPEARVVRRAAHVLAAGARQSAHAPPALRPQLPRGMRTTSRRWLIDSLRCWRCTTWIASNRVKRSSIPAARPSPDRASIEVRHT
jgi:hypothetical protein